MRPLPVLIAVFLAVLATGAPNPASATTETIVPSVEADPGTVSGNPGDLAVADDVRVTIAQEDVTALVGAEVWLKPDGDDVAGFTQRERSCATEFECLDDDPVHDENTTYIVGNGATPGDESRYSLEDWAVGVGEDITIASLTPWSVARVNGSAHLYSFNMVASDLTDCTVDNLGLTQAFVNVTGSAQVSVCGTAEAWTPATVSGALVEHREMHPQSDLVTVTAIGVTVTYSDSDFQIIAYLNFTSIPCPGGCDYELRWEGYEDGPDSALLQVDADGVWTTVATLDSSGDTSGSYIIPAEYADLGAIRFRIVDTVTDDETGGNVYLDLFAVDVTPQGGGGTGLPPVEVSCAYQWASGNLNCTAIVRLAESLIDGRIWLLDDRVVAQGRPGSHSIDVQVGRAFAPFRGTWNITLEVVTVVGSVLVGKTLATADSMWLWAVYGVIILVIIILIANRYRPPRRRTEPPPEVKE